ncbi:MAG: TrkH family potassium uptake protein [Lachnospiraceae bacterium]|nr:TrkH family potassium uptake protein [Ruminococcus sp.]MCM1274463.1 TrkH family potassium uptake protein [Lachnospiraceae bacterium]
MNKALVFHYLSKMTLVGSALFLLPALVSLCYGEFDAVLAFIVSGAVLAVLSLPMTLVKPKSSEMYTKEGFIIVAMLWIVFPLAGALPFYISGEIPRFVDAVFESVSGFTTTGSTILSNVEGLSHGMLFWRSFSHWIGGMGILVFALMVFPSSKDSMYLMRAECPGPQVGKFVPKGKNTAVYMYSIYGALTLVTFILLCAGGMPAFDSVCHAMGTAGTGGFGIKNAGIAYYNSAYIDVVITVMMMLFGVNFNIFYFLLIRRFKDVGKNLELRVYVIIIAVSTLLIGASIYPIYRSVGQSLRYAAFQVVSIMTTTGFATADFNLWPAFSQMILVLLMLVGACAGSTGGGFKVQRLIILFKNTGKYFKKLLHPKSVSLVTSEDKAMDADTVHGVHCYLGIYLFLMLSSMLLISVDNCDFATNLTAVTACFNNIGPGINKVGPMENFSFFSDFSKIVLSMDMLLGRLECLPMMMLFVPSIWRKKF